MITGRYTKEEDDYIIAQYKNGVAMSPIARALKRSFNSVKARLEALSCCGAIERKGKGSAGNNMSEPFSREETPDYNKFFRITGDAISVSDAHVPYWHRQLFEYIFAIGKKFLPKGKRILIFNGDLLNLDSFSRWVTGSRGVSYTEQELNSCTNLLRKCLTVFDKIYWTVGNHENRLHTQMGGNVQAERFLKMITTAEIEKKVEFSSYPYSILNGKIRITHPKNYGGTGGAVPTKLADKHNMNVVGGHNHNWGWQASYNGKNWGLDQGMGGDPEKLEYHQKNDTTNRTWQIGFTLYLNSYAYPFNLNFTDFNFWLKKIKL